MPWENENPLAGALGFASNYMAASQARKDQLQQQALAQQQADAQAQQQAFTNQMAVADYGLKKNADTRETELQPGKIAAQDATTQKTQADTTLANIDAMVKQGTAPAVISSAYSDALQKKYGVTKDAADAKIAAITAAYAGQNAQAGLAKTKQELDNLYLTGQSTIVNMNRTQTDIAQTQQNMGFAAQDQPGKLAAQNLGNVRSQVDIAKTYGDITGTNAPTGASRTANPRMADLYKSYTAAKDSYGQSVTTAKARSPLGTIDSSVGPPPVDPDTAISHAQDQAATLKRLPPKQRQAAYQKDLQDIRKNFPPYIRAAATQAYQEAVAGKPSSFAAPAAVSSGGGGGGSTAANPFLAGLGL